MIVTCYLGKNDHFACEKGVYNKKEKQKENIGRAKNWTFVELKHKRSKISSRNKSIFKGKET